MKTKIIYISGGELFEMSQIRAAFEEVKATLGLGKDTILFGVPVDCDNAIEVATDNTHEAVNVIPEIIPETIPEIIPETITETAKIPENQTVITGVPTETIVDMSDRDIVTEEAPVVPILSVLAINEDEDLAESVTAASEPKENMSDVTEIISDIAEPVEDIIEPVADEEVVVVSEAFSVDDIADDDVPDMPMEKTLEQLLESMTPLREDVMPKIEDTFDAEETHNDDSVVLETADTDATLAQLASEFALTEDKIAPAPRAETSGKIGKLKNILPFKKAKREDNSLMGDLFGWAGIAANDEDFSIPGFFTPAKKQGA